LKSLLYICSFFAFVLTIGCSGDSHSKHYAKDEVLVDSLFSYNDSFSIKKLKKNAVEKDDQTLLNVIDLWEITIKLNTSIPTTETEKELLQRLEKYRNKSEFLAHTLTLLSHYYWLTDKKGNAIESGLKAYNIYSSFSAERFPLRNVALYDLASKFYYYRDYISSKKYFLEISRGNFNSWNTLALCYRNLGMYDSSAFYFKKAYADVDNKRSIWRGIIRGNIGINDYLQGKYEEAVPLLKEDITRSSYNNGAIDNAANSLAILAGCYMALNKPDSALSSLDSAYSIVKHNSLYKSYQLLLEIYPRLADLYKQKDNAKEALYLREALKAKDSLVIERNAITVSGALHKVDAEKHIAELSLLEQQKSAQQYIKNALIVMIVLITAFAVIFILYQRIRHKYRLQRIYLKHQEAEQDLKEASRQLETFTSTIHEKNELIEKFTTELEYIKKEEEDKGTATLRHHTMAELQQLTILTEEEWENFRLLFEKVHTGFFFRLKDKLPGLSPADTRFIALAKLKLSNKEIAGVLGIEVSSVRVTKSRLKKKLGLQEEGNIEEVIEKI
jgi:DNA-directed RNA polymerase specialized sigma24 family protein